MLAYLVIRDGTKWSDVFRLVPGRRVTIGRANTSQIVIQEEQASRLHAEIFSDEGTWYLRDLESRNGFGSIRSPDQAWELVPGVSGGL